MAVRIHVAGARNITREDFLAAFAALNPQSAEAVKKSWVWVQASVWGVRGETLDEILAQLPGPALRITSQDGCRWYLRLFKEGLEPFVLCHHFMYTRDRYEFFEDDFPEVTDADRAKWLDEICPVTRVAGEEKTVFGEIAAHEGEADVKFAGIAYFLMDQRVMFGCPTPRDVVARLLEMPDADAMQAFLRWQLESLLDALLRFEIPHDPKIIEATFLCSNLSNREMESDLGNMPRLLANLGFGRQFEDWVAEMADGTPHA